MTEQLERKIIALVAADRLDVPISSMSGKLKRMKPKLAAEVDLSEYGGDFHGERAYARVREEEGAKARGMKDAIDLFCEKHPQYGTELRGLIAEQRITREPHLYFGVQAGCRLTSEDYMQVMTNLGFSETRAESMYQELMTVSRNLTRTKSREGEERSILVG